MEGPGNNYKTSPVGSRHPEKTKINGGWKMGRIGGGGRKAGTLTNALDHRKLSVTSSHAHRYIFSHHAQHVDTSSKQQKPRPEHSLQLYTIKPKEDHSAATFISFVFFVIGLSNSFVRWVKSKKHTNLLAALRDVGGFDAEHNEMRKRRKTRETQRE